MSTGVELIGSSDNQSGFNNLSGIARAPATSVPNPRGLFSGAAPARNRASVSARFPAELYPNAPEPGSPLRLWNSFSKATRRSGRPLRCARTAVISWVREGGRGFSCSLPRQATEPQNFVSGTMLPNIVVFSWRRFPLGSPRRGIVHDLAPASRQFFTSRHHHHATANLQAKAVRSVLPWRIVGGGSRRRALSRVLPAGGHGAEAGQEPSRSGRHQRRRRILPP